MTKPKDSPDPAFGAALAQLRAALGLSQEALAQEAGLSVGALQRIEAGRANPTWTTVRRIADALGVSLRELSIAVEAHSRPTGGRLRAIDGQGKG